MLYPKRRNWFLINIYSTHYITTQLYTAVAEHSLYELFASHRMTLQLVIPEDFACAKLSSGTAAAAADNWRGVDSRAWLRNREKAMSPLKITVEIWCTSLPVWFSWVKTNRTHANSQWDMTILNSKSISKPSNKHCLLIVQHIHAL